MKPLLLIALLQATQPAPAAAGAGAGAGQPTNTWAPDPAHSAVGFRVRHLGITWVNGAFKQWTAELKYDPANPEAASVTARIAPRSARRRRSSARITGFR